MKSGRVRWITVAAAALLSALLAACPAPARAACTGVTEASLSLGGGPQDPSPPAAGVPLVSALLDGHPASFVLDTGAERSVLAAAGRRRLALPPDPWVSTAMRGIGGALERYADARVTSLSLAGIPLGRRLGAVRSLPVVPDLALPADGLLGADLLAAHDLELTGGGQTLVLHRVLGCAGLWPQAARAALFPWAEAAAPSLAIRPGLFIIAVRIGGATLRALIDTGAALSIISPSAAARLGVDPAALRSDQPGTARGVGPAAIGLRGHDFGPVLLVVSAETRAGAGTAETRPIALGEGPLWVGALPPRAFDLILGMDRLRALRLVLSHATGTVFVARLAAPPGPAPAAGHTH